MIGGLLGRQRVIAREDAFELTPERELVCEAGREWPQRSEQQLLAPQQGRALTHKAAVEHDRRPEVKRQPPLEVAREDFGRY